jgi:hypothetical protein
MGGQQTPGSQRGLSKRKGLNRPANFKMQDVLRKSEAYDLLSAHLATCLNHAELERRAESKRLENFEVCGESGLTYQIKIQLCLDEKLNRDVRIVGSIVCVTNPALTLTQALVISPPR